MVHFHECESYRKSFAQEDASLRTMVEKELAKLKHRRILTPSKRLKVYDRSGIWISRLQGRGNNARLLFQEYPMELDGETHQIFMLREYIKQADYEPKWRNKFLPEIEAGKYQQVYPLSEEEVAAARRDLQWRIDQANQPPPPPPPELTEWFAADFSIDPEFAIYETQYWLEFCNEQLLSGHSQQLAYISDFYALLKSVYEESEGTLIERLDNAEDRSLFIARKEKARLIYEAFALPTGKVLLIHNGWIDGHETEKRIQDKQRAALTYEPLANRNGTEATVDQISKGAVRAYSGRIFRSDRDQWVGIQTQANKSNLALSPEQLDLLKDYVFPKFINGQAGSGKSEMLYYLFAEVIFRKMGLGFEGKPVFLTENAELLKKGMLDTKSKLMFNSAYDLDAAELEDLNHYFSPFREFLLDNFIEEPDAFPEELYVNFARFKTLYHDSHLAEHIKKRYPAEIAWFVIYSFIKGQDASISAFTLEQFRQLPRRDRDAVDEATYEGVYEHIYQPFYRQLRDKGYWDQLDLVRAILNEYEGIPQEQKLTAILCDEAQDFTRVELQLLIRLSRFTDYDLRNVEQVPITFAGDPFQTVNPTGFSLVKLRRLFTKELESELGFKLREDLVANLAFNYRSAEKIVDLANAIQYFRRRWLDTTDLQHPQEAKRIGTSKVPTCYTIDTNAELLIEKLASGVVFLLPCNDGEEASYAADDKWLNEDLLVKSAARAKGAEYPSVALYKFGEEFTREFTRELIDKLIQGEQDFNELSSGEQFKLAFFFNKLYVAITRAQEECYILDTEEGMTHFWKQLLKMPEVVEPTQDSLWAGVIKKDFIVSGNPDRLKQAKQADILAIAEEEARKGESYEDAQAMRDAAKAYRQCGTKYKTRAVYCEARALLFEKDYRKAGDLLRSFPHYYDQASDCYWIGKCWPELRSLHQQDRDRKAETRLYIADIMTRDDVGPEKVLELGQVIAAAVQSPDLRRKLTWRAEFVRRFSEQAIRWAQQVSPERARQLGDELAAFPFELDAFHRAVALLYYRAKQHHLAVQRWLRMEDYESPEYFQAQLEVTTDPGNRIIYWHKLNQKEELLREYNQAVDTLLPDNVLEIVIKQCYDFGRFAPIFPLLEQYPGLKSYLLGLVTDRYVAPERLALFQAELIEFLDERPTRAKTWLTRDFFDTIATTIVQLPAYFRVSSSDKQATISKHRHQSVLLDVLRQHARLIARGSLQPDTGPEDLNYQIVQTVVCFAIAQRDALAYLEDRELLIALERTVVNLLDITKLLKEKEGFMLLNEDLAEDDSTFIQLRVVKLFLKRKMLKRTRNSHATVRELSNQATDELQNELDLFYEQLAREIPLATSISVEIDQIDQLPQYPNWYLAPITAEESKTTVVTETPVVAPSTADIPAAEPDLSEAKVANHAPVTWPNDSPPPAIAAVALETDAEVTLDELFEYILDLSEEYAFAEEWQIVYKRILQDRERLLSQFQDEQLRARKQEEELERLRRAIQILAGGEE